MTFRPYKPSDREACPQLFCSNVYKFFATTLFFGTKGFANSVVNHQKENHEHNEQTPPGRSHPNVDKNTVKNAPENKAENNGSD